MRKWPLLFAFVAVVVIGCGGGGTLNNNGNTNGGGGGGTTTTAGGGGTTGRNLFGVGLPNTAGRIDLYFLPGQGRAPIYTDATVGQADFIDTFDIHSAAENQIPLPLTVQLDGFAAQNRVINTAVPAPASIEPATHRLFTDLSITFDQFQVADGSGNPPTQFAGITQDIPNVSITTYTGRVTALQLRLNDAMFDFSGPIVGFLADQFNAQNVDPSTGKVTGFLSDYLSFDISNVPNKPLLVNDSVITDPTQNPVSIGGTAKRLFVSGDFYAIGDTTPAKGKAAGFEVLGFFGEFPGQYYPVDPLVGVKHYQLLQPNPTNPPFNRPTSSDITSQEGAWFDASADQRITNAQQMLMIAFPPSLDGSSQECVILSRTGTTINNMWFGTISYTAAGGPAFLAFPIADLQTSANYPPTVSAAGAFSGALSNLVDTNGAAVSTVGKTWWQNVRGGTFATTKGGGVGVPSSGSMIVYRL